MSRDGELYGDKKRLERRVDGESVVEMAVPGRSISEGSPMPMSRSIIEVIESLMGEVAGRRKLAGWM